MTMLETAKMFGQGFFNRATLAERLENEDPARALLAWIRTAVDAFLGDSGGPANAAEGWEVFSCWIKNYSDKHGFDRTRAADQLLQRISTHAEKSRCQCDPALPVTELRIVEPWIEEFFTTDGRA